MTRDTNEFMTAVSVFQLTSSQGGWHVESWCTDGRGYFNSHPHKEDDSIQAESISINYISTHILRRRMTTTPKPGNRRRKFQLTSSQGGWHSWPGWLRRQRNFNSHPRKEDDRTVEKWVKNNSISTHILARRMTAILNKNNLFKITYYINNKHFISIVDIFFHFHIYF